MKLTLKNFRCYLDKEFDFGEEGLVLLSGQSGSGKSTLMMAIMFVLFGTGKKLSSFGKSSTEVKLEIDNIVIKRKKTPNHLVLKNSKTDETYEDKSAQDIINERFGKAFDTTSYIRQNAIDSFIIMSPTDKLEFLEKFAIDIGNVKIKTNQEIKKRNEELIIATSQYEMASEHLKTITKPMSVSCQFKTEKTMKNEYTKLKNSKILIKRKEKEIQELREELSETRIYNSQINSKKDLFNSYKYKLDIYINQKLEVYYEGDDVLEKLETDLKEFLKTKELAVLRTKYLEDKTRLELMEYTEKEEIKSEIEKIKNMIWIEYKKDEALQSISEYNDLLTDINKIGKINIQLSNYKNFDKEIINNDKLLINNLKEKIQNNKELINKILLEREILKCPACESSLRLVDNILTVYDMENDNLDNINEDDLRKEIKTSLETIKSLDTKIAQNQKSLILKEKMEDEKNEIISKYEEELPDKNEVESTISELKNYLQSQTELENKLKTLSNNLKNNNLSNSYNTFLNSVIKMKENLDKAEKTIKKIVKIDEESTRDKINLLRNNRDKYKEIEKNIKIYSEDVEKIKLQIDEIHLKFNSKYTGKDIDILNNDLDNFEKELSIFVKDEEKFRQNVETIEKYKRYREDLEKYIEWTKKVESLKQTEELKRNRYSAASLLKEKILQAESLAITNIINSINIHAQEYLDLFFPNDPIVVRLSAFKESKKKNVSSKPQINMEIDYKGMEADITMLSGGELARVVLAFTLALSEIFNSPILLLDECTASLDQETTSIVMEGIRKNFSQKLVISIAHQVVSGDFDRQINL